MIASVSAAAARVWITSGLPAVARRADVRAKALALPAEVAGEPVIVEPGLADGDDFRRRASARRARPRSAPRCPRSRDARRRSRRDSDARARCACTAGQLVHFDGDAQRVRDAVVAHRVEHLRQIVAQLGKIEMAVRIDEHRQESTQWQPTAGVVPDAVDPARSTRPSPTATSCASSASSRGARPGSARSSPSRRRRSRRA